MSIELPKLTRRRGALVVGTLGVMLAGMLSATDAVIPTAKATRHSSAADALAGRAAQRPAALTMRLADDEFSGAAAAPMAPALLQGPPEQRLIAIYRLIAQHRLDEALQATEALTRSAPTFKLAQLVHADLLSARVAPLSGFGAGINTHAAHAAHPADKHGTELALLHDEARLRIRALQERPPAGAVPDEFVVLPPSVRFAVAVDTSRSRLYLFENTPQGPRLVDDYYISVGKQGVDKLVEGDQKTPLGVYFITDRIDPRSLEDRFGAGALPLNYPNVYDKARGRTGSGILVHGVPSNTYSRPPLDSDGCVAMANDDLLKLARQLPQRDTPVIITREIKWVSPGTGQAQGGSTAQRAVAATEPAPARQAFLQRLAQWQDARLGADREGMLALYGDGAMPADSEAAARFRQRLNAKPRAIDDLSVLTWHDDKDVMVVTFRERSATQRQRDRIMRQYWSRTGAEWRIMAEAPVR